jgi:hypothetical protein
MNYVCHSPDTGTGTKRSHVNSRIGLLTSICLCLGGCAAAVKQAAESAAPAAVEGAVEEAKEPSTRDALAEILEDPDIRASSAELSESVAQGFARGVEEEVPVAQMQRVTDALVASAAASIAKSLERDIAPRLSSMVERVIDESFEHALNEQSEQRLRAVVATVTRATIAGANEAFAQVALAEDDPLNTPSARLTRNAWQSLGYNGAHGFERAVREAQLQQMEDNQPSLLATLGTVANWTRFVPMILLAAGGLSMLALVVALTWALVLLKRERRRTLERVVIKQSSGALPPLDRLVRDGIR